jgi:hypothetical protein
MRILHAVALASGLAVVAGAFPVMAQQGQPGGMMGPGPGGMMGQGPSGMMSGGPGGANQATTGPGACSMMMGPGMSGMMGPMMGRGMGRMMMGPGMGGMMGPMMGMMMMGPGPMMEGQLAYEKAELGITGDQTAAWDEYVAAIKEHGAAMQGMHADMMQIMQTGNATARLDAHIKAMEAMLDSLKALKPATEALYAVLSDEQKKKADQLLGGGCGMM